MAASFAFYALLQAMQQTAVKRNRLNYSTFIIFCKHDVVLYKCVLMCYCRFLQRLSRHIFSVLCRRIRRAAPLPLFAIVVQI